MITREIVAKGYDNGIINLIMCPHAEREVVCEIGEYWFYFGGTTAEDCDSVEQFKECCPREVIISDIWNTLNDFFYNEEIPEYKYYESYLKEQLFI